jgi:ABC-type transport system involved in multi-copper enzyme maturation permease subunit
MIAPAPHRTFIFDLWDNPIIRREGVPRGLRQTKRAWLLVIGLTLAAGEVWAALFLVDLLGDTAHIIGIAAASLWAGLVVLLAGLHGARTIAQERTAGTWDQVIVSALSRRHIVVGKLLGTLIPLWLPGLALLPFLGLVSAVPPSPTEAAWGMAMAYGFALLGGVCAASLGLWWSVRSRSVFSAQLATVLTGWGIITFAPAAGLLPALFLPNWAGGLVRGVVVLFPGAAGLIHLLTRFEAIDRGQRK